MADKTSWTKPLARMTYGDCIATGGRLEAGAASEGTDVGRPGSVDGRGADGSGGSDGGAQGCAGVVGGAGAVRAQGRSATGAEVGWRAMPRGR
jgi:hypothetical protein